MAFNLEVLNLAGNPIDDLGALGELYNLRVLSLADNGLQADDLHPLKRLTNLETLNGMDYCNITVAR